MGARTCRVVISYKEPTFKAPDKVYEGTLEIKALTPGQAKNLAIERFRDMAADAMVHWTREIVLDGIRVERADGAVA